MRHFRHSQFIENSFLFYLRLIGIGIPISLCYFLKAILPIWSVYAIVLRLLFSTGNGKQWKIWWAEIRRKVITNCPIIWGWEPGTNGAGGQHVVCVLNWFIKVNLISLWFLPRLFRHNPIGDSLIQKLLSNFLLRLEAWWKSKVTFSSYVKNEESGKSAGRNWQGLPAQGF